MKTILKQQYFTVPEAGQQLGVSVNTIYTYIRTKKIKAKKVGHAYYIRPDWLKTFMEV